jgi:hypothetical protein
MLTELLPDLLAKVWPSSVKRDVTKIYPQVMNPNIGIIGILDRVKDETFNDLPPRAGELIKAQDALVVVMRNGIESFRIKSEERGHSWEGVVKRYVGRPWEQDGGFHYAQEQVQINDSSLRYYTDEETGSLSYTHKKELEVISDPSISKVTLARQTITGIFHETDTRRILKLIEAQFTEDGLIQSVHFESNPANDHEPSVKLNATFPINFSGPKSS